MSMVITLLVQWLVGEVADHGVQPPDTFNGVLASERPTGTEAPPYPVASTPAEDGALLYRSGGSGARRYHRHLIVSIVPRGSVERNGDDS